jgi:predicted MarR family transcription regulator
VSAFASFDRDGIEVSRAAVVLRFMSGLYDQAARAASSL